VFSDADLSILIGNSVGFYTCMDVRVCASALVRSLPVFLSSDFNCIIDVFSDVELKMCVFSAFSKVALRVS